MDLFDRSGTLHVTIFFNMLGNVRLQQGSLFKFSVDAAALTSTTGVCVCRRCWRSLSCHQSLRSAEPWTEKASERKPAFSEDYPQNWRLVLRKVRVFLCLWQGRRGNSKEMSKRNFRNARIFILKISKVNHFTLHFELGFCGLEKDIRLKTS